MLKNSYKQILALVMIIALVLVMIPVTQKESEAVVYGYDTSKDVIRGVVENITQLPQYGKTISSSLRGTKAQPFFILEVVPYEEEAEFGYLIDGCEPIDVYNISESELKGIISTISQAASFNNNGGDFYYFADDADAASKYQSTAAFITEITNGEYSEDGYLEYVGTGNGNWTITANADGTYKSAERTGNGNGDFIWHKGKADSVKDLSNLTVGDYLDTTVKRVASKDDPAYLAHVSYYTSKEVFLTQTLGLSSEEAANFSVLVKTISADELNKNPEWIDYADLINISSESHTDNLPSLYQKYNRLNHSISLQASYKSNGFIAKDISWEAALRMYNKITADENYAGLILDDIVYNDGSWNADASLINKIKKTVSLDVYDLNGDKVSTVENVVGYNNNMYKLAVMLLSMDSDLFKLMYLTPQDDSTTVILNGKNMRQAGNAQSYWSMQTFLFLPDNTYKTYTYWFGNTEAWENYHMDANITTRKNYVVNHVYTYQGYAAITQCYLNQMYSDDSAIGNYADFAAYCTQNGLSIDQVNSSVAVRFILGNYSKKQFAISELNVLDIEPCVALDANNQPDWQVDEAYIRKLIPSFKGTINVVHQTTAEFNGKIEDLNSTYQMIFIGTDCGAYNLTTLYDGSIGANLTVPYWNDKSLGNLIYLHQGDMMYASQVEYRQSNNSTSYRNRSVKFLNSIDYSKVNSYTAAEVRFLGNDITSNKKSDLENYLKAGYPIVTASYLYNLNTSYIDSKSYIYQLVSESKSAGTNLYKFTDLQKITELLATKADAVTFISTPKLYNGSTVNESSAKIANPNYLNPTGGDASLNFVFEVADAGYAYRIYVDQDKDSKYDSDEVVYESNAVQGTNTYSYRIASVMYGSVMWKIEVYNTANAQLRYETSGCSAVKRRASVAKKTINVLQIMPDNTSGGGYLNLQESSLFQKYYNGLEDYNVSMTSISWSTFEGLFSKKTNEKYSYTIDTSGKGVEKNAEKIKSLKVNGMDVSLDTFNMIIVGFSDTYGAQDISDRYGAVQWLQHYADSGKSILFTHDTTSMYNLQYTNSPSGTPTIFGSTLNAMMRDRLGMNTYGMISNQLSSTLIASTKNYQTKVYGGKYTSIDSTAIHGFTYSTIQRLGDGMSGKPNNKNANSYTTQAGYKMIYNKLSEFKDSTDTTTTATQVNQGQITTYPYFISDDSDASRSITVAATHAQWYTLNLEDEDVTVWYTLGLGSGTDGLTYAVSPGDAANNYYIYSKGNIFYSGVGHSTVSSDIEAKLFVNTMVAAYQASMEPPVVEILNQEAVAVLPLNYTIEVPQEINVVSGVEETEELSGIYEVEFAPYEMNLVSTTMTMTIQIADNYVDEIYLNDTKITANAAHQFVGVANGQSYVLRYNLSNLSNTDENYRNIKFEISNNKVDGSNTTNLNMSIQPLFALD